MDLLLVHYASLSNGSGAIETPIGLTIENGRVDVVCTLLKHDQSLVEHRRRPLVQDARRGSTEMVEFLCEAGVDTSYEDLLGQTALHKACIDARRLPLWLEGRLAAARHGLGLHVPELRGRQEGRRSGHADP